MSQPCGYTLKNGQPCPAAPLGLLGARCKDHADLSCDGCGRPAVRVCPASTWCFAPLCQSCEHAVGQRREYHAPTADSVAKG